MIVKRRMNLKINQLKINGFGKLSNREIKFHKNINVIYGENEAGKSTALNFIQAMFYGVSRNKNGKELSTYDQFLPWKAGEYSGKMDYELDNGEKYEIFRDFKKKNPVIYNQNKQDISLNFPIDKNKGIDFIYEQTNLDENTVRNTMIISQDAVKLEKNAQNGIVQKISNLVSTGDETISYQKTIEKINKKQLEDIGTGRTREKPINILDDEIEKLENLKEKVENYKTFLEENDVKMQEIQDKIEKEEIKLNLYRVLDESNEKSKIKRSEIEVIKNINDEYFEKIGELDEKIDSDAKEKIKNEKKSSLIPILISIIFIICSILFWVIQKNEWISFSLLGIVGIIIVAEIVRQIKWNKMKKSKIQEIEDLEKKIEHEIDLLKNNIKTCQSEIDTKLSEIREAENEVNRLVMNQFEDKLDAEFIEEAFELENKELDRKISGIHDEINRLKIEKGAKESQKELMHEELNKIANIQEELESLQEEKKELLSLDKSYNLAKEGLKEAYEIVCNSINPDFVEKLSKITSKISNNKYQEAQLIDTDGLVVQIEDGRYLPVERLSQGTIDQMYLGLRLASIDTISNEKMPLILDETFAYFDDNRLENILKFLNEEYSDRQIIIFTCSKRECEILKKLNIMYHSIEM